MTLVERIFTRDSGRRHLFMLIPLVLVTAWSYVLFALIKDDWMWFTSPATLRDLSNWYTVGMLLGLLTGLAAGVYWNAVTWMIPCIVAAFLNLLGAIPIVNLLIPGDTRHSYFSAICDVAAPATQTVTRYYDGAGRFMYELDDRLPMILAIPLGILVAPVSGVLCFVMFLLAAIALPVLSPIILVVVLQLLNGLYLLYPPVGYALGIIGMLSPVFLFLVHPVISFKID